MRFKRPVKELLAALPLDDNGRIEGRCNGRGLVPGEFEEIEDGEDWFPL